MKNLTKLVGIIALVAVIGFTIAACGGDDGDSKPNTPLSSAKAITAFTFASPAATGIINEAAKTISVTVPFGTTVTDLTPTIAHTGKSYSPTGAQNFTNLVTYTVTAEDGSKQNYTVTVTVASASAKAITAFTFASPAEIGIINEAAKTISVTVPYGTVVTALTPTIAHTGKSYSPTGAQNFTNPITYTVTAHDNSTQNYTVTVTIASASSKVITAFTFTSLAATGIINETAKTIAVTVPNGTAVTAITPTVTHTGKSYSPTGAQNFTNPVTYTVMAHDNSTQNYTVTVTVAPSGSTGTAPTITTASLPNGTAGTTYSQTLTATGDTPITWSRDSGALPTGLSLAATGAISGTPTTKGTFNFTVKATNAAGNNTKQLSIQIIPVTADITIELAGMNEWNLTEQSAQVTANKDKVFTVTGTYTTYKWYLDGVLVGTSQTYTFNKPIGINQPTGIYQLAVVVTNSNGEGRSGRCRVTVVVDPIIFSENFEGATHSFTIVNNSYTNKWYVGNTPSVLSIPNTNSTKSAYISNNNGTSNAYTITSGGTVHMYRDVTFPYSTTGYTLSFDCRVQGETSGSRYDYLRVYLIETSVTPGYSEPSGSGTITLGTFGMMGGNWSSQTISIPATNSGTTKRLVFTWVNDSSDGTQPPAAVDNIVLKAN